MTDATGIPPPIAFAGKEMPLLIFANGKEVLSIDRDHIALHGKRVDDSGAVRRALVTALLGPGCAPVWQPIETADKIHGQTVLGSDGQTVFCMKWDRVFREWTNAQWHQVFPTHWMPLPAPPR